MPFKSEKIIIKGTTFDRRIKLSEDDKELIRWLREEEKTSYQKLADQFNVSKRLIIFICKPETLIRNREMLKKRGGSKLYYDKETQTLAIKEHRRYKQELYINGSINLKNQL